MTTAHLTEERGRRFRRRPPRRGSHGPLWLPLIVFAAVALHGIRLYRLCAVAALAGAAGRADAPALPITVAGVAFNVPPAAIRVPVQRRPGAHERVDLAFAWPSLEPPDPHAKQPAPPPGTVPAPTQALERIFVTIAGAGDTLPPAERVLTIYPRYAAAEADAGPGGLTVLAFREGTPYQGEDLIYDATAPGFLVRCTRNGAGADAGHLPLRAADRGGRHRAALPARLARRLARGRRQDRPADREVCGRQGAE